MKRVLIYYMFMSYLYVAPNNKEVSHLVSVFCGLTTTQKLQCLKMFYSLHTVVTQAPQELEPLWKDKYLLKEALDTYFQNSITPRASQYEYVNEEGVKPSGLPRSKSEPIKPTLKVEELQKVPSNPVLTNRQKQAREYREQFPDSYIRILTLVKQKEENDAAIKIQTKVREYLARKKNP